MRRLPATTVYYGLELLLSMPTWVVMSVYLVSELNLSPLQLVLMGTAILAALLPALRAAKVEPMVALRSE